MLTQTSEMQSMRTRFVTNIAKVCQRRSAYLRPPEKWSLFGRTGSLLNGNISPLETSELLPYKLLISVFGGLE